MVEIPLADPAAIGFDVPCLQHAYDLLERWSSAGEVPAAALCFGRHGRVVAPRFFGRLRPNAREPLRPDALFLIASISKPITATAVMLLVERGKVKLDDHVSEFVPDFARNGKADVQVRHLLTHTSGLPDMVPSNNRLRAEHRPFSDFVAEICRTPLLFPPGTQVSYQSMGIAMLAEIVHQVSGSTVAEFLRAEVFEPLGMADTSLGLRADQRDRLVPVRISAQQSQTDWNWNSPYWLGFGAPWGGLITSPLDFARICLMMLGNGRLGDVRLLGPATVRAMRSNQIEGMPLMFEADRRTRPWGLGWRLNGLGHPTNYGDLLGPRTYGHSGASGTLCWLDPESEAFFIIFTNQPEADPGRRLPKISNIVAGAML
jgi:CubicO group peptidase (beta-lactamase class C family)